MALAGKAAPSARVKIVRVRRPKTKKGPCNGPPLIAKVDLDHRAARGCVP